MFLDDERYPDCGNWIIVRTVGEAIRCCRTMGCPNFISFDHDLGYALNGKDFVNWMVEQDIESHQNFIPRDFKFGVHSQNSEGAKNISMYLTQYLAQRYDDGGYS